MPQQLFNLDRDLATGMIGSVLQANDTDLLTEAEVREISRQLRETSLYVKESWRKPEARLKRREAAKASRKAAKTSQ